MWRAGAAPGPPLEGKGWARGRAAAAGSDTMRAGQFDGANLRRRFMHMTCV